MSINEVGLISLGFVWGWYIILKSRFWEKLFNWFFVLYILLTSMFVFYLFKNRGGGEAILFLGSIIFASMLHYLLLLSLGKKGQ